jgi:membrane protein DedA with SNARE-associated domain
MDEWVALFERYGLPLVFGAVFVEQIGPPIPSGPLLILAGALSAKGQVSALAVAGVAWLASMLGKIALYILGRHHGPRAMNALCRMAVSPDSSIEKTGRRFARWGGPLLIVAEFIPGVRTLAPTLAGAEKLRPTAFALYSAIGAVLWTGLYVGIGLAFRTQIDRGLALVQRSGTIAIIIIAIAIAAYFVVRWWRRRRSLNASGTAASARTAGSPGADG